jgi:L-seryl-tRNA(Ser) seleniumtransferase
VIPGPHRDSYDRCFRAAGARIRTAGTPEQCSLADLDAALDSQVVAVAWFSTHESDTLALDSVCATAHAHGIPVIVDAAYGLPPADNLTRFVRAGADVVVFSGGKALRGPQASGILAGRADLVRSVALQHQDFAAYTGVWDVGSELGSPGHGIGRAMKVGKEEIIGALVALERYAERDAAAERAELARRAEVIEELLTGLNGVSVTVAGDPDGLVVVVAVDAAPLGVTAVEIADRLSRGQPRILVLKPWPTGTGFFEIDLPSLQQGEAAIVGQRVRDELLAAHRARPEQLPGGDEWTH